MQSLALHLFQHAWTYDANQCEMRVYKPHNSLYFLLCIVSDGKKYVKLYTCYLNKFLGKGGEFCPGVGKGNKGPALFNSFLKKNSIL